MSAFTFRADVPTAYRAPEPTSAGQDGVVVDHRWMAAAMAFGESRTRPIGFVLAPVMPSPDPLEEMFAEERGYREKLNAALARADAEWIYGIDG